MPANYLLSFPQYEDQVKFKSVLLLTWLGSCHKGGQTFRKRALANYILSLPDQGQVRQNQGGHLFLGFTNFPSFLRFLAPTLFLRGGTIDLAHRYINSKFAVAGGGRKNNSIICISRKENSLSHLASLAQQDISPVYI